MFICREKVRKLNADLGERGRGDNGRPRNIPVSVKVLQTKLLKRVIKPPRAAVMILTLQAHTGRESSWKVPSIIHSQ